MTTRVDTIGEFRVRHKFNPSNNTTVHQIKEKTANLINMAEGIKLDALSEMTGSNRQETARLAALAQTAYEEAAMWLVKAATADNI
jgi:hypothetical protein